MPEGNKVKLLHIFNVVQQSWLVLKKLNREGEIANTQSLTKVKRLLPANIKREWTHKSRCWGDDEKFERLIDFLTEKRQVIEYMEDGVTLGRTESRGTVYLTSLESENLTSLTQMIDKLTERQESGQRHMLVCLNSMAQTMMNVASQTRPRGGTFARRTEQKSKRCWYHGSPSHEIDQCETFSKLDVVVE